MVPFWVHLVTRPPVHHQKGVQTSNMRYVRGLRQRKIGKVEEPGGKPGKTQRKGQEAPQGKCEKGNH